MSILIKLLASKLLEMGEEEKDPARAQFLAEEAPPRETTPAVNQPVVGPTDEEAAIELTGTEKDQANAVKNAIERAVGIPNLYYDKQDNYSFAKAFQPYNFGRRTYLDDAPGTTIVNAGTKYAKSMAKTFAERANKGTRMFSPDEIEHIISIMPVAEHGIKANDVNFTGGSQDGGPAEGLFQMEPATLDTLLGRMVRQKDIFDVGSARIYPFGEKVVEAFNTIAANRSSFLDSKGGKGNPRGLAAKKVILDEMTNNPALSTWLYINWLNLEGDKKKKSFDVPPFSDFEGTFKFLNQINRPGKPAPYLRNIYAAQYGVVADQTELEPATPQEPIILEKEKL